MKMSIRLIALLFIGFASHGQETLIKIRKDTSSQMKTLFKPAKLNSFGLSLQSQVLLSKAGPEHGMSLQLHLNNRLSLGLASFNSLPKRDDRMNGMTPEPRQRFSAFTLEATPMANKIFHLSFPLAIGRIQEGIQDEQRFYPAIYPPQGPPNQNGRPYDSNESKALGVQPGINLEVNLLKYVKVFGGANYRFAFGEEKTPGMSRGAATFGVKLGVFDKHIRRK
jgi:hypothetical protein